MSKKLVILLLLLLIVAGCSQTDSFQTDVAASDKEENVVSDGAAKDDAASVDTSNVMDRKSSNRRPLSFITMYDTLYEEGKFEEALELINEKLEEEPEDVHLLNEKGYALMELGEYEQARTVLEKSVQINDQIGAALSNLSLVLNGLGEYDKAVIAAQKAINLNENDPEEYINMGNAKLGLEEAEEAIPYYDQALEVAIPESDAAYYAIYGKGAALIDLGSYKEGISYLEEYFAYDPEDVDVVNLLTLANDLTENYKEALLYIEMLIDLEPEYEVYNLDYKGQLLTYDGQLEGARDLYADMVEQYPSDKGIGYYGESFVLIHEGKIDEGLRKLEKAVEEDPSLAEYALMDPLFETVYDHKRFMEILE